jgi:hypothetical protein
VNISNNVTFFNKVGDSTKIESIVNGEKPGRGAAVDDSGGPENNGKLNSWS